MDYDKVRKKYGLSKQTNVENWLKCKKYFEKNFPNKEVKIEDVKLYNKVNKYSSAESCLNKLGYKVLYPCVICGKYFQLKRGKGIGDSNYTAFNKGYAELKCHSIWLKEYVAKREEEKKKKDEQKREKEKAKRAKREEYGIYGIYINKELVYIGKTIRDFKERWKEHENCVKDRTIANSNQPYLYEAMRNNEYEFVKLVDLSGKTFYDIELQCMEFALIEVHKPKYNYVGVKVPYEFKR